MKVYIYIQKIKHMVWSFILFRKQSTSLFLHILTDFNEHENEMG